MDRVYLNIYLVLIDILAKFIKQKIGRL